MTNEERAYNYASTQKCTKLRVGEIAKHYNNGYKQAMRDFLEKAEKFFSEMYETWDKPGLGKKTIEQFKQYMQDESEN